jgi:nitroreductase
MTFLELARKRQSVRSYSPASVLRPVIDRCLEAARLAPSACNSQPWHFIVVDDPALKTKLAQKAFSGVYSMNAFAAAAPVLVVVVRDRSGYFSALGGFCRGLQFGLVDIGIACEHFVLQAQEEGVGTCWLGWFDEHAVKKLLNIPKNRKADMMISMGYPADDTVREKARKPLSDISRFNT